MLSETDGFLCGKVIFAFVNVTCLGSFDATLMLYIFVIADILILTGRNKKQ